MISEKGLNEFEKLSQYAGGTPALVQGGGGNTSVKLDDSRMAVKASGVRLDEVTDNSGFVVVDFQRIKTYIKTAIETGNSSETECGALLKESIIPHDGTQGLRPSVEAGFHSILKKYVIHTHPVYANILCCSREGKKLVEALLEGSPWKWLWIPYVNPGLGLTLKIYEAMSSEPDENETPDMIFLANHGFIVTADDCDTCIEMHRQVLKAAKKLFSLEKYPDVKVVSEGEKRCISGTAYLRSVFKNGGFDPQYLDKNALYPDQLVYLKDNISTDGTKKINIDTVTGRITYNTSLKEALALEETLLGCVYVVKNIIDRGMTLSTMNEGEMNFINNWESEKYRKSMAVK